MTNTVAIGIGLFILAFLGLSIGLGLDWHIFLARRFVDLIDLLTVWR
ncbi:MAG: hypothetical protein AAFW64_11275 [Pseudomonadota bacterium]